MFWQYNASSPQIDNVLFKEDLTLNELLDQENVLQELKSQNKKLVDFITRGDVMSQLVSLVTEEPSIEMDERERYRRPNIACEILTTDIPILNERLSEKSLLSKLYGFLETDPPLNTLLASFFSRTLSMLICRKADQNWYSYQFTCLQFLDFLKSRDNSLKLLLKHLGTSVIMDLTLKLITQVEGTEMQQNILGWLENEGLVDNLVALFHPSIDADRHYNAAQLLCDTIRRLRENIAISNDHREGSPILEAIQSPDTIEKLLSCMLGDEISESSIIGGITVLLALLEQSDMGQQTTNNQDESASGEPLEFNRTSLRSTILATIPYLPKLHNLLINPPKNDPVKLACGTIDPPLGKTRLTVIKLFDALIATNTPEVNSALDELNTIQVLLDLFLQYTWNNFLHTQVEKCLAFALVTAEMNDINKNILISNIFVKCNLLQRIMNAWEDNESEQSKGGKRRGYMGHLTNIAHAIVKYCEEGPLNEFLKENVDEDTLKSWEDFAETVLKPIGQIHQRCLGGNHPAHDTSEVAEGVFKDIPFSENLQQNFPDFQPKIVFDAHYTSPSFYDDDDQQNAQEDLDLKAKFDYFKSKSEKKFDPNLEIPVIPSSHQSSFAIKFDAKDNKDGLWALSYRTWEDDDAASNSSDEEKGTPGEENFDSDLWRSVGIGTPVVDPGNPWLKENVPSTTSTKVAETNEGWANFDSNFISDQTIEQQFKAIALADEIPQPSVEEENLPSNGSEKIEDTSGTSQMDAALVPNDTSEKSDNNANLNSLTQEDTIPKEDELIDNFRFLSKQGMIVEPPKQQIEVEDIPAEVSISDCGTIANETVEQKQEVPGEPV